MQFSTRLVTLDDRKNFTEDLIRRSRYLAPFPGFSRLGKVTILQSVGGLSAIAAFAKRYFSQVVAHEKERTLDSQKDKICRTGLAITISRSKGLTCPALCQGYSPLPSSNKIKKAITERFGLPLAVVSRNRKDVRQTHSVRICFL